MGTSSVGAKLSGSSWTAWPIVTSPTDTESRARPPLFKVHVFSVSPAAQWSGRHLRAPVRPDGESRPKHMRYDGDSAPGDAVGLQAEKGELPREPLSAPHYAIEGEQQDGHTHGGAH